MENLSNRFVSRTKSLITFSKNGLRIPEKGVEVQVDGAYCKKAIITSFILQYLCHSRNKIVTLH